MNEHASMVDLGERQVGSGRQVCVIAEIGINHGGDLQKALRLIDVAVEAGGQDETL